MNIRLVYVANQMTKDIFIQADCFGRIFVGALSSIKMTMMMMSDKCDVISNYRKTSDSCEQAGFLEHLCKRHARPNLQIMMIRMMILTRILS